MDVGLAWCCRLDDPSVMALLWCYVDARGRYVSPFGWYVSDPIDFNVGKDNS